MGSLQYDSPEYVVRRHLVLGETGISCAGTVANVTTKASIRFPRAVKILKAEVVRLTGGTAAGPLGLLSKSLAGTGAAAAFGTANLAGTVADGTGAAFSLTATSFASGDHLLFQLAAGTAAATPVVSLVIEYVDDMFA